MEKPDWYHDGELFEWLLGIHLRHPRFPGRFLIAMASAARNASETDYLIIRETLITLKSKYPEFRRPALETNSSAPESPNAEAPESEAHSRPHAKR